MNRYSYTFFLSLCAYFLGHGFTLFASPILGEMQSSVLQKKEQVVALYHRKRYAKANQQIQELLPLLKNRTDRLELEFYEAYCNYYQKNYTTSADQFHMFTKHYPTAPQVEEAAFMSGYSLAYKCKDVDIRLDQSVTYDAINALEDYLAAYPMGNYIDKATETLKDLQERLMKKTFAAAPLYLRLGYYNAAIVSLNNLKKAYPDSTLTEAVQNLLKKVYEKLTIATTHKEKRQCIRYAKEPLSKPE